LVNQNYKYVKMNILGQSQISILFEAQVKMWSFINENQYN